MYMYILYLPWLFLTIFICLYFPVFPTLLQPWTHQNVWYSNYCLFFPSVISFQICIANRYKLNKKHRKLKTKSDTNYEDLQLKSKCVQSQVSNIRPITPWALWNILWNESLQKKNCFVWKYLRYVTSVYVKLHSFHWIPVKTHNYTFSHVLDFLPCWEQLWNRSTSYGSHASPDGLNTGAIYLALLMNFEVKHARWISHSSSPNPTLVASEYSGICKLVRNLT